MNIEDIRQYALQKNGVTESLPFGNDTLVFKLANKIFLLMGLSNSDSQSFNAKCDPEKAISWREQYYEVVPGYHMNKKHWNTVSIMGSLTNSQLKEMIDDSYNLIHSGLPKTIKEQLQNELERKK